MSRGRALVFGESVIDYYPGGAHIPVRRVAGAPLHVAAHLAAMDWHVGFVTRIGRDPEGEQILAALERHGVDASLVEVDADLPTGRVRIELDEVDNRFIAEGPAAWDRIQGPVEVPEHDALCYGTIASRSAATRSALLRLLDVSHAPLRVMDVNLRPPDVSEEIVQAGVDAAAVLKMNEHELLEMSRLLGMEPIPEVFFSSCKALQCLCITRGRAGAELYERSGASVTVGAPEVEVLDSVGAGDAFTAGLIDGLHEGGGAKVALLRAVSTAGSVLGTRGGLPAK